MPPKKAAASSLVGEYDIELMNEEELRMYVEALKEEHQRMRKARNLYQKDKSELLGFLKSTQDNNTDRAKKNIQKDFEIQELMMTGEQKSKYEDESNKIMALENGNKTSRRTVESYVQLKTVEFLNKEKEEALIKDIAERNRDVKHLQYTLELMLTHMKENACTKRFESNIILKNNSENLVHEYNENFLTFLNEFSENKIAKLQAIWGDIPTSECNPFVDILSKMTMYFKDIFLKNSQAYEKLYVKFKDLKKELNTATVKLRTVVSENDELRICLNVFMPSRSSLPSFTLGPSFSLNKLKTAEELTYENYVLTIKHGKANKEFSDLKNSFINTLRRIYQAADFRALLLEEKLQSQQEESNNS